MGGREIGFLFGQYKRIKNEFTGVLTGKGIEYGGSLIRPEATGYGIIYFTAEMQATRRETLKNKIVCISGSGNVAQYAVEKVTQMGGKVVTLSDSNGFIYDPERINAEKLEYVRRLKNVERGRIYEYAEKYGVEYFENKRPWSIKCDIAMPYAKQNEIDGEDARVLLSNGCICVAEGDNMPSTPEAVEQFHKAGILYGPGKAANAGGVATSGLEITQNSLRMSWTADEVDKRLKTIMKTIHDTCVKYGKKTTAM